MVLVHCGLSGLLYNLPEVLNLNFPLICILWKQSIHEFHVKTGELFMAAHMLYLVLSISFGRVAD